jgi:type IV secretory pathway VirB10-like protein
MADPLTNEQMSPDASPSTLSRRPGVRRVNNLPMYLIGGVMIAKNMKIAPTLEIRPGYRFNVIVARDMPFSKPYQSFDY